MLLQEQLKPESCINISVVSEMDFKDRQSACAHPLTNPKAANSATAFLPRNQKYDKNPHDKTHRPQLSEPPEPLKLPCDNANTETLNPLHRCL